MILSVEQENAINHIDGPALVLAVPGAGKTTVLINRTKNLIDTHGVSPERILSITFSKASALDMKNRFTRSFPEYDTSLVKFSTIHAFCFGLIREYSYINNVQYKLIENDDNTLNKYNLLKQIHLELNKEYITEEKLESLLNSIGYIKNMMITPEEYMKSSKVDIANFIDIYSIYESYKRKNLLLDFDDMLTISLEILSKNKSLLHKYRHKYDYFQLDEGQDTSKIQLTIIKLLASPKNNLFIVADDDQSIYGFRGAFPKGLLEFTKEYKNGKLYYMEKNYRSSKNIVSICNKFIKTNKFRYSKEISTDNGYLEPINIVKVKTVSDQYKFLLEDLKKHNLANSCILYRNNLSSVGLMEILEKNNINFYMRDSKLRFFNHWMIQDITNFMNFSYDTSNMEIYETLYYKAKGYIAKKHINYAKTLDYRSSVFDRIMEYPGLSEYYKRTLRELKLDFKKLSKLKPYESILYIENDLEYSNYLRENSMKFGYTYENLMNILFYLKLIAKSTVDLSDFIGRLNHLQYLSTNSKDNKDTITLSTIHSAKGLEYENVYIVDLVDGDFPNISSIEAFEKDNVEPLEEERRLFYVGMTRAKKHLTLITTKYIGEKLLEPSRFITELQQQA
ncbi:ATP-dependent helicase [Tissierella sp. Yu-01]|uniref:ATP-dependent helicase n=1 Tax=Tissierella sp. Yu-01 TaxID=3035694 RepID=UPI00240DD1EC|nr:ATP-dependent helicase [Tissierella sp. Yu-01]WFA10247.1 ATP-dependent helicase [Tissierella sp. Yu-01]